MSQSVHASGNVFSGDFVADDRFGADQQTVERARDPKIVRSEILASFLDAFFIGVGGDHIPPSLSTLLLVVAADRRKERSEQTARSGLMTSSPCPARRGRPHVDEDGCVLVSCANNHSAR